MCQTTEILYSLRSVLFRIYKSYAFVRKAVQMNGHGAYDRVETRENESSKEPREWAQCRTLGPSCGGRCLHLAEASSHIRNNVISEILLCTSTRIYNILYLEGCSAVTETA